MVMLDSSQEAFLPLFFLTLVYSFYFSRQIPEATPTHLACCISINTHVYLQVLQTLTSLPAAHSGWGSSAWCPQVTPWPLLALLPCCPDTVGLLSPDQAWGQTFWEFKGRGMRWWCHRGCWRVAYKVWGWAVSRVLVTHTRVTVLWSQPVGTLCGTEPPLMALNSAWWLALI